MRAKVHVCLYANIGANITIRKYTPQNILTFHLIFFLVLIPSSNDLMMMSPVDILLSSWRHHYLQTLCFIIYLINYWSMKKSWLKKIIPILKLYWKMRISTFLNMLFSKWNFETFLSKCRVILSMRKKNKTSFLFRMTKLHSEGIINK